MNIKKSITALEAILNDIEGVIASVEQELINNKKPINEFIEEKNIPGVYAFFIKPKSTISLDRIQNVWLDKNCIKYPKVVLKRFNESISKKQDIYTFYLGKSEKVDYRINQHIKHTAKKTTYSLKLNDRKKFLDNNELFFSKFEIEELAGIDSSIIQFIITRIESKLRGRMNPWVGRQ